MQPTYFSNPTAPTAVPGQQSPAVLAYQNQLNQTNVGKPGYVPLTPDGKYGPLTLAASKFGQPTSSVVSTNDIHRDGAKNSSYLTNLLSNLGNGVQQPNPNDPTNVNSPNYSDAVTQGLDAMSARSDAATKRLIQNVQATRVRNGNAVDTDYNNYKSGLQLLGIQHNDAQFTPDLLQGHIQQAENEHMQKINDLDMELNKAVADATDAQENNDFKTLQEKTDYIKQLKQDQKTAITDMYTGLSNQTKSSDIEAHDIYDSLQTLDPNDQEAFINAVANKFNLPVAALVQSLADEKGKRTTADLKTQNSQATLDKKSGSGGSSTFKISTNVAKISPQFEAIKGGDGYIDPQKWVTARANWNKLGGTDASFNTTFKKYLNPASYALAGFKVPKGSTSADDILAGLN